MNKSTEEKELVVNINYSIRRSAGGVAKEGGGDQ